MMAEVRVVPYDPSWPVQFKHETKRVERVFASHAVQIHHIGSTSIPAMYAKPIIDMLLVLDDIAFADVRREGLTGIGYEAMGEFGIAGRRYFRKNDATGQRTHHLHSFAFGSAEVTRHLAFRDYLRAHSEAASEYSALKQRLARSHPNDMSAYMDGKDAFIKQIEAIALARRAAA